MDRLIDCLADGPPDCLPGCLAAWLPGRLTACAPSAGNVINTVTTVGYGDSVPYTMLGKITATAASVCGIVVLALPIAVFENNFARMNSSRDLCHRFIQVHMHTKHTCTHVHIEHAQHLQHVHVPTIELVV